MPVLAKLVDEYDGGLILAKVDTEAEQEIAAQLGIRSLPTCKLIVNGAMAGEFSGAQPESEVRAFLTQHIGEPQGAPQPEGGGIIEHAQAMAEAGQQDQALALLREAQAGDPEDADVAIALGQMCVAVGNYDDARQCLSILEEDDRKKPEAVRLSGLLTLSDTDDASRDEATLSQALQADPKDSDAAYYLGVKQALRGDTDGALDSLLGLMMRDREYGDDGARKLIITIFDIMGDDPRVSSYRRRMASLLN